MTDGRILYADDMQRAAAIYFPQAYQITPDYRDNGRVAFGSSRCFSEVAGIA